MAILVRKINKAKWYQVDLENGENVSADAITNCLKTSRNTLSFWKVESDDEKCLDEAALAILGGRDNFDAIDIITIDVEEVKDRNIEMQPTPGRTFVKDLEDLHVDLSSLDYCTLGSVSECLANGLVAKRSKRYTKTQLKQLLTAAIDGNRVSKDDIPKEMQYKLWPDLKPINQPSEG